MATSPEVRIFMNVRLSMDNFVNVLKAGDQWDQMAMGFYYLDEQQVDIATKEVMLAILKSENKSLPDAKWTELRKTIDLGTAVSASINIISDISQDGQSSGSNL